MKKDKLVSTRRLVIAAAVLVALVFAAGVLLSPPRVPTVSVIGDHADEVRSAMGVEHSEEATVTIVLLNRWDSLRHMPDVAELCWDACHTRVASQISLTQMRFGKTRKVVIFYLPDFDGNYACVATRAAMEMMGLRGSSPSCHVKQSRRAIWILPMGLGRLS